MLNILKKRVKTMNSFNHLNQQGEAHMTKISHKPTTRRQASAQAIVHFNHDTFKRLLEGVHPKGDIFAAARIAGIVAAKKTSELIPLCHPLALSHITIDISPQLLDQTLLICSHCETMGQTGVEMEALTAVSVASLTIYDMCKSIQKDIWIGSVHLLEKSGGVSGQFKTNSKREVVL